MHALLDVRLSGGDTLASRPRCDFTRLIYVGKAPQRASRACRGLESPPLSWSRPISSLGPPTQRRRGQLQSGVSLYDLFVALQQQWSSRVLEYWSTGRGRRFELHWRRRECFRRHALSYDDDMIGWLIGWVKITLASQQRYEGSDSSGLIVIMAPHCSAHRVLKYC